MLLEISIATFVGLALTMIGIAYSNYSKVRNFLSIKYLPAVLDNSLKHHKSRYPSGVFSGQIGDYSCSLISVDKNLIVFYMSLPTFGEYMSAGFKFSIRAGAIDLDKPPYPSEIQLEIQNPLPFNAFIPMPEITSLSELGMR
jgi:hypothetical protein